MNRIHRVAIGSTARQSGVIADQWLDAEDQWGNLYQQRVAGVECDEILLWMAFGFDARDEHNPMVNRRFIRWAVVRDGREKADPRLERWIRSSWAVRHWGKPVISYCGCIQHDDRVQAALLASPEAAEQLITEQARAYQGTRMALDVGAALTIANVDLIRPIRHVLNSLPIMEGLARRDQPRMCESMVMGRAFHNQIGSGSLGWDEWVNAGFPRCILFIMDDQDNLPGLDRAGTIAKCEAAGVAVCMDWRGA